MNTLKAMFTLIITIVCFQFGTANATETPITATKTMMVQTIANTSNTVDLRLVGNLENKIMIHLKDASGKVLYFEKVNNRADYFRRFSLAELADGNYHFSIRETDSDAIIRNFSLKNGTVKLKAASETVVLKAAKSNASVQVESTDSQSISFQCLNQTNAPTSIRLMDTKGKVWFYAKVKAGETCTKKLILSELPVGEYKIHLDGDNTEIMHGFLMQENGVVLKKELPRA